MGKDSLRGLAAPGSAFPWKLRLSSIGSVTALHGIAPVQSPACSHCSLSRDMASAFLATVLHVPFPPQPHPSPVLRNFLCAPLSISSLLGRGLGNVQAVLVTEAIAACGTCRNSFHQAPQNMLRVINRNPLLFVGSRQEPSQLPGPGVGGGRRGAGGQ